MNNDHGNERPLSSQKKFLKLFYSLWRGRNLIARNVTIDIFLPFSLQSLSSTQAITPDLQVLQEKYYYFIILARHFNQMVFGLILGTKFVKIR